MGKRILKILRKLTFWCWLPGAPSCACSAHRLLASAPGSQKRPKEANFAYVLTMSKAFSRPWHRISRQKCWIWMHMCRVIAFFVVFENFWTVLHLLKLFCVFWNWFACFGRQLRGSPQAIGEAALAADLITAWKFRRVWACASCWDMSISSPDTSFGSILKPVLPGGS